MSKPDQKFHKGDHVHIAKDLGRAMRYFDADCDAIVVGSGADRYRDGTSDTYTLHIKGKGEVSWYYEHQLTMIEAGRVDLLKKWEAERSRAAFQASFFDGEATNG